MGLELHSFGENRARIDWRKVCMVDENSFEIHLFSGISVVLSDVHDQRESVDFSLWHYVEKSTVFARGDFKRRVVSFGQYKEDRVSRLFKGTEFLFFDREECDILEAAFLSMPFSATVTVLENGNPIKLIGYDGPMLEKLISCLNDIGIQYLMDAKESLGYYRTKQVKQIMTKSEYLKGGKVMPKKKLIFNLIAGSMLVAASVVTGSLGLKTANKALSALLGEIAEVILVEND